MRGSRAYDVLGYLWDREMVTGVYRPRTLGARVDGRPVRCRTFTAARTHVQYAGRLSIAETAAMIATAQGVGGIATHLHVFVLQEFGQSRHGLLGVFADGTERPADVPTDLSVLVL